MYASHELRTPVAKSHWFPEVLTWYVAETFRVDRYGSSDRSVTDARDGARERRRTMHASDRVLDRPYNGSGLPVLIQRAS